MNKFEEHIRSQRPWMDVDSPDLDSVWEHIEADLPEAQAPRRTWSWVRAAAAAVVLIVAGTLAHQLSSNTDETGTASLLPESYLNEENILQASVNQLMAEIEAEKDTATDLSFLQTELNEIDQMDRELRETLATTRDQEKVLQRLLDHYQKKIRVLQRMLREVKKRKQQQQRINRDYV